MGLLPTAPNSNGSCSQPDPKLCWVLLGAGPNFKGPNPKQLGPT